jgi:hypothetical protein
MFKGLSRPKTGLKPIKSTRIDLPANVFKVLVAVRIRQPCAAKGPATWTFQSVGQVAKKA